MSTPQLEKIQEFLTCVICTDTYIDPCTLTCQHTFCRKCVTEYTKTKPEALQTQTIPCPSCRQVTKVPDPTRPVGEWAKQIKPSIIILGLIDTSQPGPATTGAGRLCNVCEHLGETTPATTWCPDCEVALCLRCMKAHRVSPASRDHDVFDLSAGLKVKKRDKIFCRKHRMNCIEFHCKDCNQPACHKCCILYHRVCKSVLDIESMKQEMTANMRVKRDVLFDNMERRLSNIRTKKAAITEISKIKMEIQSQIRCNTQQALDRIKEKEKQLMDKLDQITETQICHLHADVKTDEIEIQMYRQNCEFIDQAVNSDSLMDMYNVYLASESGALVVGETRDLQQTQTQQIENIRLTQDPDKIRLVLNDLQLGQIDVTYQDGSSDVMSSPVLMDEVTPCEDMLNKDVTRDVMPAARLFNKVTTCEDIDIRPLFNKDVTREVANVIPAAVLVNTTDIRTKNDKKNHRPYDVIVMFVNGVETVVVTDLGNSCIKSFYTRYEHSFYNRLSLDSRPWAVAKLEETRVMVAVPDTNQIVRVEVNPHLVVLSRIKTSKRYYSLGVLSPSSLAAGCGDYPACVDILTMTGEVVKSITHHNNLRLFTYPNFMAVNNNGNIVVSDVMKSVICITPDGEVVWQYDAKENKSVEAPGGVTTTNNGDILISDPNSGRVVQLTEDGEFVREIITSKYGLSNPDGIFCDGDSLFVCDDALLKFKLS